MHTYRKQRNKLYIWPTCIKIKVSLFHITFLLILIKSYHMGSMFHRTCYFTPIFWIFFLFSWSSLTHPVLSKPKVSVADVGCCFLFGFLLFVCFYFMEKRKPRCFGFPVKKDGLPCAVGNTSCYMVEKLWKEKRSVETRKDSAVQLLKKKPSGFTAYFQQRRWENNDHYYMLLKYQCCTSQFVVILLHVQYLQLYDVGHLHVFW